MLQKLSIRQNWILTILILITSIVLYRHFIFGSASLAYGDVGGDTFHQYIPAYQYFIQKFQDFDLSTYNFSYGLGTSIFTPLSWIADPFSLLNILFGMIFGSTKVADVLVYTQILKLICAGLLCRYYLKQHGFSNMAAMIASYIYAFSGYMMATGQHYFFAIFPIYFILLLILIDKSFQKPIHLVTLALVTALICARSPYNAYMCLLAGAMYVILYASYRFDCQWKEAVKKIFFTGLSMFLGLLISMVSFLPQAMEILSSSRVTDESMSLLSRILESFSWVSGEYLKTGFLRLFSNGLEGSVNNWTGVGVHFSFFPYFFSAIFILLAIQFIINTFRKSCSKRQRVFRLIGMVLFLFSVTNFFFPQMFNVFVGAEYRYMFVVLPLFAFVVAETIDRIMIRHEFNRIANYLGIICCSILIVWLTRSNLQADPQILTQIVNSVATIIIGGLLLDLLYLVCRRKQKGSFSRGQKNHAMIVGVYTVLFVCICVNLFVENNVILYTDRMIINKSQFSAQASLPEYRHAAEVSHQMEGENFYRIDADFHPNNSSNAMYSLTMPSRTISMYNTMVNGNFQEFMYQFYQNEKVGDLSGCCNSYGCLWNTVSASTLGLKYILSMNLRDCADWELVDQFGNYFLYRNKEIQSAGLLYDSYFTEEESQTQSLSEKNLGLAQAVVLDTQEDDISLYAQPKEEVEYTDNSQALNLDQATMSNVTWTKQGEIWQGTAGESAMFTIPLTNSMINASGKANQLVFTIQSDAPGVVEVIGTNGKEQAYRVDNITSPFRLTANQEQEVYFSLPQDTEKVMIFVPEGNFSVSNFQVREVETTYQNDSVHFENVGMQSVVSGTVSTDENKILYMPIPYEKGWSATIDGQETEIYRANYGFQALLIPEGTHTIQFAYSNPYLKHGVLLSCVGVAGLVVMVIVIQIKKKTKMKI